MLKNLRRLFRLKKHQKIKNLPNKIEVCSMYGKFDKYKNPFENYIWILPGFDGTELKSTKEK